MIYLTDSRFESAAPAIQHCSRSTIHVLSLRTSGTLQQSGTNGPHTRRSASRQCHFQIIRSSDHINDLVVDGGRRWKCHGRSDSHRPFTISPPNILWRIGASQQTGLRYAWGLRSRADHRMSFLACATITPRHQPPVFQNA